MQLCISKGFLRSLPQKTEVGWEPWLPESLHLLQEKRAIGVSVSMAGCRDFDQLTCRQAKVLVPCANAAEKEGTTATNKAGKKEHHLWMRRDSAGSVQKAIHLVRIVSKLPNEKEAIYGALDKWIAWEAEFPVIAAAKALNILRKRRQWLRIIQVTKWMLSKGQGMTMGTYDTLLLAFDMNGRVDEAESAWNMILQTHTRSVSRRLFSRMISLYNRHHMPEKVLEVFADMEELGVKPDDDTLKRIGSVLMKLGQEDKQKQLTKKYEKKWKYLHFNGQRVRVRTTPAWDG